MSKAGDTARERGFTLLEALVVVGVTALIATIAFPRIERGVSSVSVHEADASMVAGLRMARAAAIRNGTPIVFSVADDGHTFGWTGVAPHTTPGVTLAPAGQSVTFFADGSATPGRFALQSGAHRLIVAVDSATGAVGTEPP